MDGAEPVYSLVRQRLNQARLVLHDGGESGGGGWGVVGGRRPAVKWDKLNKGVRE